jgi:hypothetical protein
VGLVEKGRVWKKAHWDQFLRFLLFILIGNMSAGNILTVSPLGFDLALIFGHADDFPRNLTTDEVSQLMNS